MGRIVACRKPPAGAARAGLDLQALPPRISITLDRWIWRPFRRLFTAPSRLLSDSRQLTDPVARRSNNTRIYLARTATTGSRTDNAYEKTASWAERRQPTSGPIRRVYFARLAESSAGVSADGSVHRCKMKASARPICGLQNASIHRQRPFQRAVEPHLRLDLALILLFKPLPYMNKTHSTNVGGAPKRKPKPVSNLRHRPLAHSAIDSSDSETITPSRSA